jgi:hypothetical protein
VATVTDIEIAFTLPMRSANADLGMITAARMFQRLRRTAPRVFVRRPQIGGYAQSRRQVPSEVSTQLVAARLGDGEACVEGQYLIGDGARRR